MDKNAFGFYQKNITPAVNHYVSSSQGDDSKDGLTPATAHKTIQKAWSVFKSGEALHLKAGDVFPAMPTVSQSNIYIGVYGEGDRPTVEAELQCIGFDGRIKISNVMIEGINFYNPFRDPKSPKYNGKQLLEDGKTTKDKRDAFALRVLCQGANDITFQDCKFSYFREGLQLYGITNLIVHRCIIAYLYGDKCQGIYADNGTAGTISECYFRHIGWMDETGFSANILNHAMYLQTTAGRMVVQGNIVQETSSHGCQMRCGGDILDNVFVDCSIAAFVSGVGSIQRNTVYGGRDITAADKRGWGFSTVNATVATIADNLVANRKTASGWAYEIQADKVKPQNITWKNNRSANWSLNLSDPQKTGLAFTILDAGSVPDIDRSILEYHLNRKRGDWKNELSGTFLSNAARNGGTSSMASDFTALQKQFQDLQSSIGAFAAKYIKAQP
jgi:hypothetical protein